MASKRAKKTDYGVEMDMTPMIDIVFLLIVFFMVVTELSVQQAVSSCRLRMKRRLRSHNQIR